MTMERKIGEIFEYNGEWYQCIIGHCNQCSFDEAGTCKFIGNPYCAYRNDKKLACFKKLEKVGEPYTDYCPSGRVIYLQRYKCYQKPAISKETIIHWADDINISIEIKQTKEDMKENKLNLKPFNLEEAKQGKPVCTRDGRKARIIAFDRRLFYKNVSYPILALVERSDGEDDVCGYNEKGKVLIEDGAEYKDDLMMLPEKKEGWVNVYQGGKLDADYLYPSKEDAVENIFPPMKDKYIDTIKLTWEE